MQSEVNKDKCPKKKKGRTWAEAAKLVFEKYPRTPLPHKEVLRIIQEENLKDVSGTGSLACLNSMLHSNSRGAGCLFYKVFGRSGVYGLMNDFPEGAELLEVEEDDSASEPHADDDEKPVPAITTNVPKTYRERKQEKVMYVKMSDEPKQTDDLLTSTNATSTNHVGVCGENDTDSLTDVVSVSTETSESSSLSASNTAQVVNPSPSPSASLARNRPKRRSGRNNPLRHYKKRKKKPKMKRIRMKSVVSSALNKHKGASNSASSSNGASPSVNTSTSSSPSLSINPITGMSTTSNRNQSLKDFWASIPGFSLKPRRKSQQKLSTAAQLRQTKEGCIDLETPHSIMVHTDIKGLLKRDTFSKLPPRYQYKLVQLLPECDRYLDKNGQLRMTSSSMNNEFFNKACVEWRYRLSDGEFTQENQLRIKHEEEKEHAKLDPWKVKHFEPVWGSKSSPVIHDKPLASLRIINSDLDAQAVSTPKPLSAKSKAPQTAEDTPSISEAPATTATVTAAVQAKDRLLGIQVTSTSDTTSGTPTTASSNQTLIRQLKRTPDVKKEPTILKKPRMSFASVAAEANKLAEANKVTSTQQSREKPPTKVPSADLPVASVNEPKPAQPAPTQEQLASKFKTPSPDKRLLPRPQAIAPATKVAKAQAPQHSQGQTRTLAQIKAQTRAKLQGLARGQAQTVGRPAPPADRHQPAILQARSQKNTSQQRSPTSKQVSQEPSVVGSPVHAQVSTASSSHVFIQPSVTALGHTQALLPRASTASPAAPPPVVQMLLGGTLTTAQQPLVISPPSTMVNNLVLTTVPQVQAIPCQGTLIGATTIQPAVAPAASSPATLRIVDCNVPQAVFTIPQSVAPQSRVSPATLTVNSPPPPPTPPAPISPKVEPPATSQPRQVIRLLRVSSPSGQTRYVLPGQTNNTSHSNSTSSASSSASSSPSPSPDSQCSSERPQSTAPVNTDKTVIPPRANSAPPPCNLEGKKIIKAIVIKRSASQQEQHKAPGIPITSANGLGTGVGGPLLAVKQNSTLSSSHPALQRLLTENSSAVEDLSELVSRSHSVPAGGTGLLVSPAKNVSTPLAVNTSDSVVLQPLAPPDSVQPGQSQPQTLCLMKKTVPLPAAAVNSNQNHQKSSTHFLVQRTTAHGLSSGTTMHHPVLQAIKATNNGATAVAAASLVKLASSPGAINLHSGLVNSVAALTNKKLRPEPGGTSLSANCACSLKAMVMCKKCGAFCHNDCIGPSKLCVTCLITT